MYILIGIVIGALIVHLYKEWNKYIDDVCDGINEEEKR